MPHSHTPTSLKTASSGSLTPLRGLTPAKALTPTPATRMPRIGFLNWGTLHNIEGSYCRELYAQFTSRAKKGEIEFVAFEPAKGPPFLPYPPMAAVAAAKLDAAVSNGIWNHDFLSEFSKLGIPAVSCDHEAAGMPFDSVVFDGIAGGERIGRELLARGHTDILFISRQRYDTGAVAGADPLIEDPTYIERRVGVQQGLLGSTAEFWPLISWVPREKQEDVVKLTLAALKRIVADMGRWPTAIVAPDLGVTVIMKKALEALGFRIPHHLSMVTFHSTSKRAEAVGIARVEYSFDAMGRPAWDLLAQRLAGARPPARRVKLAPAFVDEASLGPRRAEP
ncbi:MAG: LacI family DNA-binding transcriptional regulator [Planctomycetota bacterium]|nr:LacI family DNA-binding transcriptional regulator [Planctomycetota bacterium]